MGIDVSKKYASSILRREEILKMEAANSSVYLVYHHRCKHCHRPK
jgi:hypothetical protein